MLQTRPRAALSTLRTSSLAGAIALLAACAGPDGGAAEPEPAQAAPALAEESPDAPEQLGWLRRGEAEIEVFQAVAPEVSLRALAAVDDSTAWIGGTGGTVARTTDAGATWVDVSPDGLERLDVRDLHAFTADHAVAMTAGPGTASRILVTNDGGESWRETHRETREASFLDGMAFWDDGRGAAYGDPLPEEGFHVLVTRDFGARWTAVPGPMPLETGEASFAASGTGIRVGPFDEVYIATGANDGVARVLACDDVFAEEPAWTSAETTILAAKPASGAFSIEIDPLVISRGRPSVAVGGDFTARDEGGVTCASWSRDGGATWSAPETGPRGQRAGCARILPGATRGGGELFVATGQTGTDVTRDGGRTWQALSDEGFHCVMQAAAPSSTTVWFAGQGGRAGRLPVLE